MYCANCGKENGDGVVFCANCGKSPNEAAVTTVDKINRVERVTLSGGIIGAFVTNARSALEVKMWALNAEGWKCRQVIPEYSLNGFKMLLQLLVLICTLFLWTFEPGYLLLLEKDK